MKRSSPKLNNKIFNRGTNTKIIQKTTYESPSYRVHKYFDIFSLVFSRNVSISEEPMWIESHAPICWKASAMDVSLHRKHLRMWCVDLFTQHPLPPPQGPRMSVLEGFLHMCGLNEILILIGVLVSSKVWRKRNGVWVRVHIIIRFMYNSFWNSDN